MKPTYLLGLVCITTRGLCSAPPRSKYGNPTTTINRNLAPINIALSSKDIFTPDGGVPLSLEPISPATIPLQHETSATSPQLFWTGSKALAVRADQFGEKTQLALQIIGKTSLLGVVGFSFYSLVGDCQSFSQNLTGTNGAKCVVGSIGTAISLVSYYKTIQNFFIEYAKDWRLAVISLGANYLYDIYTGGRAGFGPFARTTLGSAPGPQKRDKDSIFKRAEEHLSSALGVEVRTIGVWNGIMPGEWQPVAKRDDESDQLIPIFGLNFAGQDVHLAYMGQDMEENSMFKIGQGPGPATFDNKLRLKARDSTPPFNNYYFDKGGLDVIATSDLDSSFNQPDIFPDPSNNEADWAWVFDQVECYMETNFSPHTVQMDAAGMWFQVYDGESHGTLSAGAIAPFYGSGQSLIQWLRPSGGLKLSETCTIYHAPYKV